jgi:hypothetical protein
MALPGPPLAVSPLPENVAPLSLRRVRPCSKAWRAAPLTSL